MVEKEHKRSVQDEQFGQAKKAAETTNDAINEKNSGEPETPEENIPDEPEMDADKKDKADVSLKESNQKDPSGDEDQETEDAADASSKTGDSDQPDDEQKKAGSGNADTSQAKPEPVASSGEKPSEEYDVKVAEESSETGNLVEKDTESSSQGKDNHGTSQNSAADEVESKEKEPEKPEEHEVTGKSAEDTKEKRDKEEPKAEPVDFSKLNKEELIEELRKIIDEKPVQEVKDEVDQIRFQFIKKHKTEIENLRKSFLEQGGQPQDFKPEEDALEKQLKAYIEQFREKRTAFNRELEESKHKNLEEKYRIIEEIKDLVNRKESLNKTFQEFRDLQARWREVGLVPQTNVKDLWETYHHHVEKFYDYIKINKELRDLDLKKNLELKIKLCEKAEELLLEPNIIKAFKTLQTYHDQWREIGPVPAEMRSEIWDRFKEATSKINKKHQEYYDNVKQEQRNNLESKRLLCEKAEEIAVLDISSYKDWDQRSDEMKELQKIWKTIGFAPRKDNNKIYDRFRSACDQFFNKKREFYAKNREEQSNNLQRKTDLCIQAEALKDSTEWKKTTEDLIELQKRWKQIGPVPKKYSDSVWKRFRAACDEFFNRKSEHFENIDSKYEDNLKLKETLIQDIKAFTLSSNVEDNLEQLKDFQRRWAEIGFVPIKKKDEIQQRYREVINKKFDNLKIDESKKNIIKFKTKLDDLSGKPRSDYRLRQDREKFLNKLKQLENDIVLWENNIGFFAKSKNAEEMISDVENKINGAKKKMEELQQKIDLIDTKLDDE